MVRNYQGCPFERYADDVIAHCDTEEQAEALLAAIAERFESVGLELHPGKTKVVFCKDANRPGESQHTSFDFLGFTFQGRLAHGRYGFFRNFAPAMSAKALKAVGQKIRGWHLNRRSGTDLSGLAAEINPQVRGWINYYGAFYRSGLSSIARRIDEHLLRWAMQKFKRLRGKPARAWAWLRAARQHQPTLFAHWEFAATTTAGLWEPYDGRLSRTVLREREGEAPSRYSPGGRWGQGAGQSPSVWACSMASWRSWSTRSRRRWALSNQGWKRWACSGLIDRVMVLPLILRVQAG
jgi:hypothetical protein